MADKPTRTTEEILSMIDAVLPTQMGNPQPEPAVPGRQVPPSPGSPTVPR